MEFNDLNETDKEVIKDAYKRFNTRKEAQEYLGGYFSVHTRTIRKWAKRMELGVMTKNITNPNKILIYDIETSQGEAKVWWSGKQYVNGKRFTRMPKIISICWKFLGEDKIYAVDWGVEEKDDKELLEIFLHDYNQADLVIGQNNKNFDNRWVNARALKHNLDVDTFVRTIDLQREAKRLLRLPSYSLEFMCEYFDVPYKKQTHEGIVMWDMIEDGTPAQAKEYLKKMIDYNRGDILATESLYLRMLPILDHSAHLGVLHGNEKYSCPHCGETENIELVKTTVTKAGTIQRIMRCLEDGTKYKLSNREYLKWFNK